MVRKKPVSARIDHDTVDALERFSDVYDYSRSEALAALASEALRDRGYLDDRADPLEGVPTLSQRVIAHSYDVAILIGLALVVDAVTSLVGQPIPFFPSRTVLIGTGVVVVTINILTQFARRKRVSGLFREYYRQSRHRLDKRARRVRESVLESLS